jgi:hypothetical protein
MPLTANTIDGHLTLTAGVTHFEICTRVLYCYVGAWMGFCVGLIM